MSPEAWTTLSALRAQADDIVDCLLQRNQNRWRSLEPADRARVELLARDVAARLLEEPARRLEREPAVDAQAVAELFALDQSRSEPRRTRLSS